MESKLHKVRSDFFLTLHQILCSCICPSFFILLYIPAYLTLMFIPCIHVFVLDLCGRYSCPEVSLVYVGRLQILTQLHYFLVLPVKLTANCFHDRVKFLLIASKAICLFQIACSIHSNFMYKYTTISCNRPSSDYLAKSFHSKQ